MMSVVRFGIRSVGIPHENHKPNGILLTNRLLNSINQGQRDDIAPTIAAELWILIDTRADGKVLTSHTEEVEETDYKEIAGDYTLIQSDGDLLSVEDFLVDID